MKSPLPHSLRHLARLGLLFSVIAASPPLSRVQAQQIYWNTPAPIVGDTDVATNGTPVYAYNFANNSQTVNGVTFTGVNTANAGGNVGTSLNTFNTTVFTSTANPFAALSAAYKGMLVGAAYATTTAAHTMTLSNLVAGHAYLVQVWVSDPRGAQNARTVTLGSLGGNSVTLNFSTGPGTTAGYPGQYCVGLFTNYGAPQTFTLQSLATTVPQVNALQVLDLGTGHDVNVGAWTGLGGGALNYASLNFATNAAAAPLGTANLATVVSLNSPVLFGDSYADAGNLLPVATANLTVAPGGVADNQLNFLNNAVNYSVTSGDAAGLTGASMLGVYGAGTVTLAGPNTYSGGTVIANGTLQVGTGGNAGSLGAGPVANYGALVFNRGDNVVVTNPITGLGTLTQMGAGTLVLSNALVGGPRLTLAQTGTGPLVLAGTNTFGGILTVGAGAVNVTGNAPGGSPYSSLWLGGATGAGAMNFNSGGAWTIATSGGNFLVGGTGALSDTGAGAFNLNSGTVNFASSGVYLTLGNGGPSTYGAFTQSGGTLSIGNASGVRLGFGGMGSWVQSGGILNCTRYFAPGGNNANGNGVATFTGGSATISASYRFLIPDAGSATAVVNLGTEAGGSATITHLSTTGVVLENNAGGNGTLNLNSGTLQLGGPIFRNNTSAGAANLNLNGATLQGGANNVTLINKSITSINVFKGGLVVDSQAYTNTVSGSLLAATGNGIYPAGGVIPVNAGGGAGHIGAPLVTVSGGSGTGAQAIARIANGVVTGVVLTCPGQNYLVGDSLSFTFAGGGAVTPANPFNYTLQAADLAANAGGGLVKIGSGALNLTGTNSYNGSTIVGGGALNATVDGALGLGSVVVANGATLIMGGGVTNGYLSPAANLALNYSAVANLNYPGGTMTINGLSTNGGLAYLAPGIYGSAGSGAPNILPQLQGAGTLTVLSTPVVNAVQVGLTATPNPAVVGQSVVLTATVTGSGAIPSGTVTFLNGATVLGSAALNNQGIASLSTVFTNVGVATLTANYSGNGAYSSAAALAPVSELVNPRLDFWTGAKSGFWDIATATNWLTLGLASVYNDGDAVRFDDSAAGGTALTLNVTVKPNDVLFTNNTKNYSLAGSGAIAGSASLTLAGAGAVTLSNSNNYTGNTVVSNGVLVLAGGGSSTGGGLLIVGDGAGTGVLKLTGVGTLTSSGYAPVGGISGDNLDTGSGAIYQSSGTNNLGAASSATYLELGSGGTNAYGYYNLSGGALNALNATGLRVGCIGLGVLDQSGGVLNLSRYLALGSYSGASGNGGVGVATFTGGSGAVTGGYRTILGDKPYGIAVLNIGTLAGGANVFNPGNIQFLSDTLSASGTLNLNSGTLLMTGNIYKNTGNTVGTDTVNLNGGTLQLGSSVASVLDQSLDTVLVYNGGLVVDTHGFDTAIAPNLQTASGNGIYPAGGLFPVPGASGGANYIGAPIVTVTGGSGAGALAIATLTNGTVAAVVLTCPGQDYQVGDVLSFTFSGGGTLTPAGPFQHTLLASELTPNNRGGLIKLGAGTLSLQGIPTLGGPTIVRNGTLDIEGSLNGSAQVTGGELLGGGGIAGSVSVAPGGAIGAGSAAGPGQLTITTALTLAGAVNLRVDNTGGSLLNDNIQGLSSVTYGGTLNVTNLTSDGTPLAPGSVITLISSAAYAGAFSAVNLPPLGGGLAWNIAGLNVDGTIKVITVSTNSPTLTQSYSGGILTLTWPADHVGWSLQVQTNHLAGGISLNPNDWTVVPGSPFTNRVQIPIDTGKPAAFYRLTYP